MPLRTLVLLCLMSETNPGLQNDIIVASQSSSRADPAEIESTNKIEDNVIDRGVPQPSNFKCPFCGNKYDSRDTVEKHLELFHKMPIEVQKSMQLQNVVTISKTKPSLVRFYLPTEYSPRTQIPSKKC